MNISSLKNNPLKTTRNTLDSAIAVIISVVTLIWFIPFIDKGIDYTDAAYNMDLFINAFSNDHISSIGTFLTDTIGGVFYHLFPSGQYLVLRIVYWLSYLGICAILYFAFKETLPKSILTGSILGGFFMIKHGTTFFAYNSMTALLLAVLLLLMVKAFQKQSKVLFALSGVTVGISTFVRLPNILQVGFVVAIIWYFGFCLGKKKSAVINSLIFIAGFIVSALLILGLFVIFNGTDALAVSFGSYVGMASDSSSSHGISSMISKFITQTIAAIYVFIKTLLPYLSVVIIAAFACVFALSKKKAVKFSQYTLTKKAYCILSLVIAIISVAFAAIYVNKRTDYKVFMYILGLSILFLGTVCAIAFRKSKPVISISAVLCACVAVVLAFGSDNIMNTYFTLFATILIGFVMCLYHLFKSGIFTKESKAKNSANACVKLLSLVLAVSLVCISFTVFLMQLLPFTYGPYLNGNGNITELTSTVDDIPALKGMKTTRERADQLEEFHAVISDYSLKNKEMAVFGYFPMAFIIAENDNYFHSSWIDLGSAETEKLMATYEEKKTDNNLPVVVESYIYMQDIEDTVVTTKEKQELLDKMLSENSYEVFYESENFTVYTPQAK